MDGTEGDIRQGDIVELETTATYYDGRIIPAWVKADKWIVSGVNGDRVVINENVSGTHAIQSPVRMKYLRKV
ncbi:MAG: hypothetical protein K2N01_02090 [Lachnospiraceae bacterium]|nr:hypothetical protein [Lachnospiraceae bacterium]